MNGYTSNTPLPAAALVMRYEWLLLPPILLCQLLHGYCLVILLPPILLCQLLHGYCLVILLPPILLCQLLHGYCLVCWRFLLNFVLEVFLHVSELNADTRTLIRSYYHGTDFYSNLNSIMELDGSLKVLSNEKGEKGGKGSSWAKFKFLKGPGPSNSRKRFRSTLNTIYRLKGQCHKIFDFWFFSWISFPQAPEYTIRAVSNFFENSRRYS